MRRARNAPLSCIPAVAAHMGWETDVNGIVTLRVENVGWANRLAQKLFGRPRYSFVRLDALGSYVWQQMDGRRTVACLGELLEKRFGAAAQPLYERLNAYLCILVGYGFARWV